MAKRSKRDATEDQVAPLTGEPLTNPQEQLPPEQKGEPSEAPGPKNPLPGSGLKPYDHVTREGELEAIRTTGRPLPTEPAGGSPPHAEGDLNNNPVTPIGSDKNYDDPADANEEDVDEALGAPQEEAPQPFRKRDGLPDITSESVQVRMLQDYDPVDPSRFTNQIRARKDELVSFPSDEALALIEAGIAERVDDEKAGFMPDEDANAIAAGVAEPRADKRPGAERKKP